MTKHILKNTLLAAAILATSNAAFAHEQSGILSNAASMTHYYQVDCGTGTDHVVASVLGGTDASQLPLVSVQVITASKGLYLAGNTTDPKSGDAGISPEIIVKNGLGPYFFAVDKSKIGPKHYTVTIHCEDAIGGHTEETITPKKTK